MNRHILLNTTIMEIVCCFFRYGDRLLLFPNKKAAQEHIEGNQLRSWLLKAAEVTKINKYTVEQLRAAKEILEPSISTEE